VGEHEQVEGNLLVWSGGVGVAGVGLPAVSRSSSEMRAVGGGGPVREGGVGKSGRTSRSRATRLEPRFGRRSGKYGSTARSSGGANGGVVLSVKTHRQVATRNTRSWEAPGTAGGPRSLGQRPEIRHTSWRLGC
jgi:hypothetical protein